MYDKIKGYYNYGNNGLWSIDRVWNVVGKATGITATEYEQITGFIYPAKS
jgi:hypothetical protein